jgi:hypothetical protein
MFGCEVETPHNNPLAADGMEIWVVLQKVLAAAEGERCAAWVICKSAVRSYLLVFEIKSSY